jgi:hypothetical protein
MLVRARLSSAKALNGLVTVESERLTVRMGNKGESKEES